MSNTGDIEMAQIKPTTSNQSQNQDASLDGVEMVKVMKSQKEIKVFLILPKMNEKFLTYSQKVYLKVLNEMLYNPHSFF